MALVRGRNLGNMREVHTHDEARRLALPLGSEGGEHLFLRVGTVNSDGWLPADVDLRIGGFTGSMSGDLRAGELNKLCSELETLHKRLVGEVIFTTLEGWIEIRFEGDGRGHIKVSGTVQDSPGIGNRLSFSVPFVDQTHLPDLIRALNAAVEI